jgi:hypothetical protein
LYTIIISESAVWALTNSGSIYRRSGITQQNYCGNNWDLIPGSFKFISGEPSLRIQEFKHNYLWVSFLSVTIDDKLWVLDSVGALKQLLTSSPLRSEEGKRDEILHLDEDWVLL